jgi:hypothetical protein
VGKATHQCINGLLDIADDNAIMLYLLLDVLRWQSQCQIAAADFNVGMSQAVLQHIV